MYRKLIVEASVTVMAFAKITERMRGDGEGEGEGGGAYYYD